MATADEARPEFSGSAELKIGGLNIKVSTGGMGTSGTMSNLDKVAILKDKRDKLLVELEDLNREIHNLGG